MNLSRRNFIRGLLAVGAAFTVLPPAAVGRVWKAAKPNIVDPRIVVNPAWIDAPFEMQYIPLELHGQVEFIRRDYFPVRFDANRQYVHHHIRVGGKPPATPYQFSLNFNYFKNPPPDFAVRKRVVGQVLEV